MMNFLTWSMTEMIAVIALITVGVYMYFKHVLYSYWEKEGVFFVEPTVPIGNIGEMIQGKVSLGLYHEKLYAKYKHHRFLGIYGFYKPALVICDPDLIKSVLVKNFTNFHDRGIYHNEDIDPLSAHLFFMEGNRWKNMRSKLTPTFTSGKMKQMFNTIRDCAYKMADHLEKIANKREVVEMKDLTARVTTDVIASTAFGIESNCIDNPNSEFRYWGKKAFEPVFWKGSLLLFVPKLMEFLRIAATDSGVTKFFTKTFNDTVEYRNVNNVTRPDFMNLLIQLMKRGYVENDDEKISHISEETGGNITSNEAVAQAFVFFLAGFETTSTTITYCLYELSRNQEIQDELRSEIDEVLKKHDGQITYESTQEMSYLNKVINETLRKYPPLPFLSRVCTNDIELPDMNFKIPKGMDLIISILGLHRDQDIYPDPMKFDPERFNQENVSARHPYVYLPFGEGPRVCIGLRFGILQTKIVLISLLSKYKFSVGPGTPDPIEFMASSIILMSKTGINLRIEPR